MPEQHAKLSASGASRWINCPPSVRFEEQFENTTSSFAEEGTTAHELAELKLLYATDKLSKAEYKLREKDFKSLYNPDPSMFDYIDKYVSDVLALWHQAQSEFGYCAIIMLEQRLDFSPWVRDGFGTGDIVIVTPGYVHIIDLKYGKGVPVSAINNSQLKLYALGAYNNFLSVYEDIQNVSTTIIQPRLDSISTDDYLIEDLLKWGSEIKPLAEQAYVGEGEFKSGDHCRFCKARAVCRTRKEASMQVVEKQLNKDFNIMSDQEILEVYNKTGDVSRFINDIEEHVLGEALKGKKWEGLKLVEGRSVRAYVDQDKVKEALSSSGIPEHTFMETTLLSLSKLEKVIGVKKANQILDGLIVKPQGKPTIAPIDDRRPEMNTIEQAQIDFKETEE